MKYDLIVKKNGHIYKVAKVYHDREEVKRDAIKRKGKVRCRQTNSIIFDFCQEKDHDNN
jgi:hypothetical protein